MLLFVSYRIYSIGLHRNLSSKVPPLYKFFLSKFKNVRLWNRRISRFLMDFLTLGTPVPLVGLQFYLVFKIQSVFKKIRKTKYIGTMGSPKARKLFRELFTQKLPLLTHQVSHFDRLDGAVTKVRLKREQSQVRFPLKSIQGTTFSQVSGSECS